MTKFILSTILIAVLISGALWFAADHFPIDTILLQGANILLAILSLISTMIVNKQITQRPQAFVRGVYGGTLLKMFIIIIALVSYVVVNKEHFHKPSIFVVFAIYMIYATTESVFLSKKARSKN